MESEVEIAENKLSRLDDFLLFLVSSVGIFYTVITAFVGKGVKIVYITSTLLRMVYANICRVLAWCFKI